MTLEWLNRIALVWSLRHRQKHAREVLDKYGSATEALKYMPNIINTEAIQRAEQEIKFIEQHGITCYFYNDTNYPYRLSQCVDAPLILYGKGNIDVNPKRAVSIVGTRMPSERGKDWCRNLVLDLAQQVEGLSIISGLAYGIDVVASLSQNNLFSTQFHPEKSGKAGLKILKNFIEVALECYFLPNSKMNQLYVYRYPLCLGFPSI